MTSNDVLRRDAEQHGFPRLDCDPRPDSRPRSPSHRDGHQPTDCCYRYHYGILWTERWFGVTYRQGDDCDRPEPLSSASITGSWGEPGQPIRHRVHIFGPDYGDDWSDNAPIVGTSADAYIRASGQPLTDDELHGLLVADASTTWLIRKARQAAQSRVPVAGPLPKGVKRHGLGYRQRVSLFGCRDDSPTAATPAEAVAWGAAARDLRDRMKAAADARLIQMDNDALRSAVLHEMGAST